MRVLYGSQTGTGQMFATQLAESAAERNWDVDVLAMDEVSVTEALKHDGPLVVVTSVFGEGVPPDNARQFCLDLNGFASRPKDGISSHGGRFAVFGLGNSRYGCERFNETGRVIDAQLELCGRQRLLPFQPGDASNDIEEEFDVWMEQLLESVGDGSGGAAEAPVDRIAILPPSNEAYTSSFYREFDPKVFSLENPMIFDCVATRSLLTSKFRPCNEITLSHKELRFETGDYVGLFPVNSDANVEEMISLFNLDGASMFQIEEGYAAAINCRRKTFPKPVQVRTFLRQYCDLQRPLALATARKLVTWCTNEKDQDLILKALADRNGALYRELFLFQTLPKVLAQFSSLKMGLNELVELLPPPRPVYYSIASSSLRNPHQLRLVVGQHHFEGMNGLCSTHLTQNLGAGETIQGLVKESAFRLPKDPTKPIIMVACGSGIAPFLAFIDERSATGGQNVLFFGCMRPDWDFLYKPELDEWATEGLLDLNVAFSHENPSAPVFAQHLFSQRGKEMFALLEQGAFLYVCGHTRMGAGFEEALREVILQGCDNDATRAAVYYDHLIESERLKLDVFA